MALIDLTPPGVEPIDLSYTKTFLRVDDNEEDTLIETLIKTARHQVENNIGRALIHRTFAYRGAVPRSVCMTVPRPPLVNIESLALSDKDGQVVNVSSAFYVQNTAIEPGEISLVSGFAWQDFLENAQSLEIRFTAGYGPNPQDVPLPIRQAIMLLVARYFEYREREPGPSMPTMVDALLAPYRWVRL